MTAVAPELTPSRVMRITALAGVPTLVAAAIVGVWAARAVASPQAPSGEGYAWAEACKSCHAEIYNAWAGTKHAKALSRLSGTEQEKECIGCHVTGAKSRIEQGGRVVNGGVQCEACHGAAAAHVADPKVKTGLMRKPPESLCVECHNDKGPHFRGFFYGVMANLSHQVK